MSVEHFPKPKPVRDHSHRPWRVDYDLAYDGGGTTWTGYYRGRRRAILAIWWQRNVASWGGTADLRGNR